MYYWYGVALKKKGKKRKERKEERKRRRGKTVWGEGLPLSL